MANARTPRTQRTSSLPVTPRLRSTGDAQGEIRMEIYVQDVSLPSDSTSSRKDEKQSYLTASVNLFQLAAEDCYNNTKHNLAAYLRDTYGGHVRVEARGTVLFIFMTFPKDKVTAVQCDHSSGLLLDVVQERLVTADVLERLRLDGLTLGVTLG